MKVLPLGDRVLIQPAKREERTASGLVIPETVRAAGVQRGEVLAIGVTRDEKQGLQHETPDGDDITHLMAGQVVYFRTQDILHTFDDGLVLVDADDLLAVVVE